MLRKLLAKLAMFSILFTMTAYVGNAALISSINLDSDSFNPNLSPLNITVALDSSVSSLTNTSGYVRILDGTNTVYTLSTWVSTAAPSSPMSYSWDGKVSDSSYCGLDTVACSDKDYTVRVYVENRDTGESEVLNQTFTLDSSYDPSALVISSFTTTPVVDFDPADSSENEVLSFDYTASTSNLDYGSIKIENSDDTEIANFSMLADNSFATWNGEYATRIVEPGTYTATLSLTDNNLNTATASTNFSVSYNHSYKPDFTDVSLDNDTFDPDYETVTLEFSSVEDSEITVEVLNSSNDVVKTYSEYTNDSYSDSDEHLVEWDGYNYLGSAVSAGTYTFKVVARNDYGVNTFERSVIVSDSGSTSYTSSNAHIEDFSLSPSTFEPHEDDEIEINFDIRTDLDEILVIAVRGDEEVEIYEDDDVEEENNIELYWNGEDDDGDYVEEGTWRIEIHTQRDSTNLVAARNVNVEYDEPKIEELYFSKDEFDNDLDEFTYIMFQTDKDGFVDIEILLDGDVDDEIEEEIEVEEDKWYAVMWDGDNYDYDDDLDIRVSSYLEENEDSRDYEKDSIDLDEDDVPSTKSNVTNDYIFPVISEGDDEFEIYYELEDDADVVITIHKGTSSTGSKVIELLDVEDQEAGDYTITWDGLDDDGDDLRDGVYTYKIVSDYKAEDTETGLFIIGDVGDIDGYSSSSTSSSSSSSSSSSVADGVVINGSGTSVIGGSSSYTDCGFSDVSSSDRYCEAIKFVKDAGIFSGYSDGTFRPYNAINRVEFLKTVIYAFAIPVSGDNSGNAGYSDVSNGSWYISLLKTGLEYGIFSGDSNANTARPSDYVNRVEALKMVFESVKLYDSSLNYSCYGNAPYNDVSSTAWYSQYVCSSSYLGELIEPDYNNNFNPNNYVSRGEIAVLFYKLANASSAL